MRLRKLENSWRMNNTHLYYLRKQFSQYGIELSGYRMIQAEAGLV